HGLPPRRRRPRQADDHSQVKGPRVPDRDPPGPPSDPRRALAAGEESPLRRADPREGGSHLRLLRRFHGGGGYGYRPRSGLHTGPGGRGAQIRLTSIPSSHIIMGVPTIAPPAHQMENTR